MDPVARIRLSIMMFLQFFIWGVWFVTLSTYLDSIGFAGAAIGDAYGTMPIACILAPVLVGVIADRFLPAQYVLGIAHLVGAVLIYIASGITEPSAFYWVILGYAICYAPTLALVNTVSFQQMSDVAKQFPSIRVLGTLGWIVAGMLVGQLGLEASSTPMKMAAGASVALGLYCFTLPNTPPRAKGTPFSIGEALGLNALKMMKDRSFFVFAVSSFLICIPLTFYYNFTNLFLNEAGVTNAASKMTMGQMSEVFFMLVMPFFFRRLGVKYMLLVGMIFWTARYVLFAYGNATDLVFMLYAGIIFHGICYDFFFVTGHIYVDQEAPRTMRASAQGFIAFLTYGLGMWIGSLASGRIVDYFTAEGVKDWQKIWLVPASMAAVLTILFFLTFKNPPIRSAEELEAAAQAE